MYSYNGYIFNVFTGIDHVQPVFEVVHMAADENYSRLLLSQGLEAIRSKIVRGELVLFVGEQLSTLVTPENQSPSLDDWWQIVNHPSEVKLQYRHVSRSVRSQLNQTGFIP